EVGDGVVVVPPDDGFPDGAHAPGDLAVSLAHGVLIGEGDLLHQLPDRLPGVHAGDHFVPDILHGVAHPGHAAANPVGTPLHGEVGGHQHLRFQGQNLVQCVDIVEGI